MALMITTQNQRLGQKNLTHKLEVNTCADLIHTLNEFEPGITDFCIHKPCSKRGEVGPIKSLMFVPQVRLGNDFIKDWKAGRL
jgi:hypothetical protein